MSLTAHTLADPALHYVTGGTVPPDSAAYVVRKADEELYQHALRGDFCYILTPRQTGKSSLMARVAGRLQADEVKTAIVDLSSIGGDGKAVRPEQWYYGVAHAIGRGLRIKNNLKAWWVDNSDLPALQRLTDYFRDVLLEGDRGRIVVFLDEIDTTIGLHFSDDFFAAIRACHNSRATDPEFKRLSFVLLGVATPTDLISDPKRTPFNLGAPIELTDFTREEADQLALGLSSDEARARDFLNRIMYWTAGHPYLTQTLCAAVQAEQDDGAPCAQIDRLVEQYFLNQGAVRGEYNLRFVRDRLIEGGADARAVLDLYSAVLSGGTVADDPASPMHATLKLSGVVCTLASGLFEIRNLLYRTVFDAAWIDLERPSEWTGDELYRQGRLVAALDAYRVDLRAAEKRASIDRSQEKQADVAALSVRVGDLLRDHSQSSEAMRRYEDGLAIRERLARQEPQRADFQRDLSVSYEKLGDLLRGLGQGGPAREHYEKALAIAERLARQEPERADFQRDLSVSYDRLGNLLLGLGQGEPAREHYEKALAIAERLARQEPQRADFQRDLWVSYNKLGGLLLGLGQGEPAREHYEKALAIAERLVGQEPERADFQRDLSVSYIKLGDLLLGLGQGEPAREHYEKALAIAERLARQEPQRADFQRDLSVSYNRLGDLLRGLGQGEPAGEYYEKQLAIAERLARQEPQRADFQVDVAISLARIGDRASLERGLEILLGLKQEGRLQPVDEPKIGALRKMLERLE